MPDMDGADVEKQFENDEIAKKIPVIFLTAIATKDDTRIEEQWSADVLSLPSHLDWQADRKHRRKA